MEANKIMEGIALTDDDCEVCELHRIAYEKLEDGVFCPHCSKKVYPIAGEPNYCVVGEVNYYEGDNDKQQISKYIVKQCGKCHEYYALIPEKIIYNANHDIYYTGGKRYLIDEITGIREAILPSIQQYYDRIKGGEDIEPSYLALWIDRKIEHLVAKYLYEKGYKK